MAALKIVWNIIKKIFGIIFLILSPLKRLFCWRKRRTSDTILPLSNHYTIPEDFNQVPSSCQNELESWDSWDNDATSNSYHHGNSKSNHHPLSRSRSQQESVSEPEIDYFEDMAPKIKKQKKVLIQKKENTSCNTGNKFAVAASTVPLSPGGELGTWDDNDEGWDEEAEEDLSWQAEIAIKEKRRSERKERNMMQQKRKQEKETLKTTKRDATFSAVRLS